MPAKEKSGFRTQFSRSAATRAESERKCASGTAGWRSAGSACLLQRKYQLGCPAHETSSGERQVERQPSALRRELVEDQAVVDPQDAGRASRRARTRARARAFSICDGSSARTPQNFSVNAKSDSGLLPRRDRDRAERRSPPGSPERIASPTTPHVTGGVEPRRETSRAARPSGAERAQLARTGRPGRRRATETPAARSASGRGGPGVARDGEVRDGEERGARRSPGTFKRAGTAASERRRASGVESWRKISSDASTISSRSAGGKEDGGLGEPEGDRTTAPLLEPATVARDRPRRSG